MKKVLALLLFGLLALDVSSAFAITAASTIDSRVTRVLVESPGRYGVTLQTASGQGARCADNAELSGAFTVTNTLLTMPVDMEGSLWCAATGTSATITIVYSMAPPRPFVVTISCASANTFLSPGQARGAKRLLFWNETITGTTICPTKQADCAAAAGLTLGSNATVYGRFEVLYPDAESTWSCAGSGSTDVALLVE